ncbi:MAG: AAA family ATPase [Bacilli bacterium]
MAKHFEKICIQHFRGIHNLEIEHLNHVNIIAGDNNSGKTSVLEALLFLKNPNDLSNILQVMNIRNTNSFTASRYEHFINFFPKLEGELIIELSGVYKNKQINYSLKGNEHVVSRDMAKALAEMTPTKRNLFVHSGEEIEGIEEVDTFIGKSITMINDEIIHQEKVELDVYSISERRQILRDTFIPMTYLGPSDHLTQNVFHKIIANDEYKTICLHVLQLFDPDIVDMLLLKGKGSKRINAYIKHAKLGNMPLSTYGDGVKKVLSLANAIACASQGILLIDEIETAIHSKYYEDIFGFLVKAARAFDVQLFITTHSIEAIDALLEIPKYEEGAADDPLSIITFKKNKGEDKTYSRVLSGKRARENRQQFGFEVRT